MFVGRNCVRHVHDVCIVVAANKEDKLRNVQSLRCNRYRSGRAAEPPLDMRKLSSSMSTRLWNIVFPFGYPLLAIFSLFSLSLSLSSSSFLAFRLAVNHSQFRCSISVSPIRFVLFHPAIKKRTEIRKRCRRWISFTVNVPYLGVENHMDLRVYVDTARADIWAELATNRGWKEHRFSPITGFELRLRSF